MTTAIIALPIRAREMEDVCIHLSTAPTTTYAPVITAGKSKEMKRSGSSEGECGGRENIEGGGCLSSLSLLITRSANLGCLHSVINCNDNNPCTTDSCDAVKGCIYTVIPGCGSNCTYSSCNDFNLCTSDVCTPQGTSYLSLHLKPILLPFASLPAPPPSNLPRDQSIAPQHIYEHFTYLECRMRVHLL